MKLSTLIDQCKCKNKDCFLYSKDMIELMYDIRPYGIPLIFVLLDLRKTDTYCHHNAPFLTLIIPGSRVVTGNITKIADTNNRHSWIETDDFVCDVVKGLIFAKELYYELNNPTNIIIQSENETREYLEKHLRFKENRKEMYIAIIIDLERSTSYNPYDEYLKFYIKKFREEKKLDVTDYDEALVQEYLRGLARIYDEIDKFKKRP